MLRQTTAGSSDRGRHLLGTMVRRGEHHHGGRRQVLRDFCVQLELESSRGSGEVTTFDDHHVAVPSQRFVASQNPVHQTRRHTLTQDSGFRRGNPIGAFIVLLKLIAAAHDFDLSVRMITAGNHWPEIPNSGCASGSCLHGSQTDQRLSAAGG